MTTAVLAHQRIKTRIETSSPAFNWKLACYLAFFVSAILLVFYVFQVNDLTKGTYQINNFQKEIKVISQENRNLEVSFAESSFLGQVQAKAYDMALVKTSAVKYLQIREASFALATPKTAE